MSLTPVKYKVFVRIFVVLAYFQLFCPDVLAVITVSPQNTLVRVGQTATFNCSSSEGADALVWLESGIGFVSNNPDTCSVAKSKAAVVRSTYGNYSCDVTFLSITDKDAGPISCQEPINFLASEAAVIVLWNSTCGVPSGTPVVQGTNISIPCEFQFIKQAFPGTSYAPTMSTYTNWTYTSTSSVLTTTSPTVPAGTSGSISSSVTIPVTGTVLPSVTCTGWFTFTPPLFPDSRFQYALNPLSVSCVTPTTNVSYCPLNVTITPALPANGQILAGTTFTCLSDGFPAPTFAWTVTGGTISSSTGATTTVTSGGPFSLTCVATGTVSGVSPCTASAVVNGTSIAQSTTAGTAAAAVTTAAVAMATGPLMMNVTVSVNGSSAAITTGRPYNSSSNNNNNNSSSNGNNNNNNNNNVVLVAAIIPASLIFLTLSLLGCYYCWAIAGDDDRRRRRSSEDQSSNPPEGAAEIGRPQELFAFFQAVFARPPRAKSSSPPAPLEMIPPNKTSAPSAVAVPNAYQSSKYVTSPADQRSASNGPVVCSRGQYTSSDAVMLTPGLYNNISNSNPNLFAYNRSGDQLDLAGRR